MAADLPSTKGAPIYTPPPPVFSWTGFYIGAQAGYEWGRTHADTYADFIGGGPIFTQGHSDQGVVGGIHLGYNWQVSQFVLGFEGDVNGSGYSGSNTLLGGFVHTHSRIPVDGSIRGRVGFAWNRALIYATGGAAFASIDESSTITIGPGATDSGTFQRIGWTVGGGVEYAIDDNWSLRAEYRYTDYGVNRLDLVNEFGPLHSQVHQTDNRVQAGFSYKFGFAPPPAPVLAKY